MVQSWENILLKVKVKILVNGKSESDIQKKMLLPKRNLHTIWPEHGPILGKYLIESES